MIYVSCQTKQCRVRFCVSCSIAELSTQINTLGNLFVEGAAALAAAAVRGRAGDSVTSTTAGTYRVSMP